MIKEIKEYNRMDLFNYYHNRDNPFVVVTTKIDVTNIINYCKDHKNSYATLGFIITKTANNIDAFKYRYNNEKIYFCDELKSNYTQLLKDNSVGFFGVPTTNDYTEYIKAFKKNQQELVQNNKHVTTNDLNEIWLSCIPWFSFTSLIPPFDKNITIPQFIWDKYELNNGRYFVNLMKMVHHGFADGYHIGKFVNLLQENINSFML